MAKKKFEFKRYQYKLGTISMDICDFNKMIKESLESIWSKYSLNTITTLTQMNPNPTTITTNANTISANWDYGKYSWDVISPSVSNFSVRFNDAWDVASSFEPTTITTTATTAANG